MSRQPRDPFIFLFKKVKNNPLVGIMKPYSRFEAWTWMLCEARHKRDQFFEIGEFVASHSFLQCSWGWEKKREVRTFLEQLKQTDSSGKSMIEIRTVNVQDFPPKFRPTPVTSSAQHAPKLSIIKIVNFKDYQFKECDSSAQVPPKFRPTPVTSSAQSLSKNKVREKEEGKEPSPTEKYQRTVGMTDQQEQWARIKNSLPELQERFPRLDVSYEWEQYKDDCASKGRFSLDHEAEFRKWLRRAEKWRKERAGPDAQNEPPGRPGPDYWYDNDFKTWVKK